MLQHILLAQEAAVMRVIIAVLAGLEMLLLEAVFYPTRKRSSSGIVDAQCHT